MVTENSVELLDYMGGDKLHSLAAWASTFYDLELELPKDPHIRVDQIFDYILSKSKRMRSMKDLLTYLAENHHESPFRMSSFVFGTTEDLVSHYQKLKHAVILEAENGESAKYKELKEDKFYVPNDYKNLEIDYNDISNASTYDWLKANDIKTWYDAMVEHSNDANLLYHDALRQTRPIIGDKRAKETSRYFKTHNSQLNTINKLSFAGVMTFYNKRTVEFAQEEIKNIAKGMVQCIKDIPGNPFEYSLKAFNL